MRYRFEIDLRNSPAPPQDGFVPTEGPARPAPQFQEAPASPQLEAVYQKLLKQVAGARHGRTPSQHVFRDGSCKHVLTRSGEDSVTELRRADDGGLVRRVYERMAGPPQSLDDLFERGLSGLDSDEARFAAYPGYELRFTRYSAREGRLTKVRMGRAAFHQEYGGIVITAL